MSNSKTKEANISFNEFVEEVLNDYTLCIASRYVSDLGRKEVLTGKAKFGIFGAGKELPQVALSKFFEKGDFRAGYYRDQTMALATNNATIKDLFAQLYANPDVTQEPNSAGRMMNAHFATRLLDEKGEWKNHLESKNFSADLSPTAAQMLKSLGLALASKHYRQNKDLHKKNKFSNKGNEVVFATIGDASTSEGIFWETINAACVLQVPLIVNVWDDGYGISVPQKYQTAKGSISQSLSGMKKEGDDNGIEIFEVKAWDYVALVNTYKEATKLAREKHTPVLVHVTETTQPNGHSTSGSHERYKSNERLQYEKEKDCITNFRNWIIENNIADTEMLDKLDSQAMSIVKEQKDSALNDINSSLKSLTDEALTFLNLVKEETTYEEEVSKCIKEVSSSNVLRKNILVSIHSLLRVIENEGIDSYVNLKSWYDDVVRESENLYGSHLFSQSQYAIDKIAETKTVFSDEKKAGFEIINNYFDSVFERYPEVVAFGEDVGKIGDVNQGFAGLQEKYGEERIFDCGIREASIVGQGIGMSMRGLRPIAEIQYLDYLLYGLQPLSDDVATLQYRTKGGQKAPLIIRTRGHRLEGIWHSGSPMGMIVNSLRGMHVCVPRNLTQAAGMYETILRSDEPALVIEPLNGYRLKENIPNNLGEFTVPMGKVEKLKEGSDITMLSYGSTIRVCEDAINMLEERGVSIELIDVQTLLPFDNDMDILKSLKETNRLVVVDEDVPGGASAYILQKVLEEQGGYRYIDSQPLTITGKTHRPAYGSDGDYFSKPNAEEIYNKVLELMKEVNPEI